jgi:hypothetical protein
MIHVGELIRWLKTLPDDSHLAIDEGGLTLECVEDISAYMEIGGLPDPADSDL